MLVYKDFEQELRHQNKLGMKQKQITFILRSSHYCFWLSIAAFTARTAPSFFACAQEPYFISCRAIGQKKQNILED
jgi:hypothetical protein